MGTSSANKAERATSTRAGAQGAFTPGPWDAVGQYGGLIRAASGVNVASTLNEINATKKQHPVPSNPDEVAANARLIAAAPELLAALQEIETICTESAADCRKRMGNALTVARDAIVKATRTPAA